MPTGSREGATGRETLILTVFKCQGFCLGPRCRKAVASAPAWLLRWGIFENVEGLERFPAAKHASEGEHLQLTTTTAPTNTKETSQLVTAPWQETPITRILGVAHKVKPGGED